MIRHSLHTPIRQSSCAFALSVPALCLPSLFVCASTRARSFCVYEHTRVLCAFSMRAVCFLRHGWRACSARVACALYMSSTNSLARALCVLRVLTEFTLIICTARAADHTGASDIDPTSEATRMMLLDVAMHDAFAINFCMCMRPVSVSAKVASQKNLCEVTTALSH